MKPTLNSKTGVLFTFLILFSYSVTAQSTDAVLQSLDAKIQQSMEKFSIKGMGYVAVQGNEILGINAFGMANPKEEMGADTYVYIASNTKAFTGLAMAKLIDQGKVDLNDPVTRYLDASHFPDTLDVSSVKISDLLAHTTGLSNDPLIFRTAYSGEHSRDLTPLIKFSYPINEKGFKYSNYGYILAGMVIEEVTGTFWKDYIKNEVLNPMGMDNTYLTVPDNEEKIAWPYSYSNPDKPLHLFKEDDTMHAAGGMFSTLKDMGTFLTHFTQDKSQYPFVEKAKEIIVETDGNIGPLTQSGYGYGWIQGQFNGEQLMFHFGSFPGYESFMAYMPAHDLGFFVFNNEKEGGLRVGLQAALYFFNASLRKENTEMFHERIGGMVQAAYQQPPTKLTEKFIYSGDDLTGTYVSDKYGTLKIFRSEEGIMTQLGNLKSPAYEGDGGTQMKVEWTPGIIETLTVKHTEESNIVIQYGDFDTFEKKKS